MLQEGTGVLRLLPRGRVEGRALGLHEVIQSGPLQLLNPRQSSCREREREREGGRGGGEDSKHYTCIIIILQCHVYYIPQ